MLQEAFKSGELLLPDAPVEPVSQAAEQVPLLMSLMVLAFVLLAIVLLPAFLHILPALADSVLRARGSSSLENSVRQSRDRTLVALVLMIPAFLLVYRYRLYDPSFLRDLPPNYRFLAIAGVFTGFMLLRLVLYLAFKPRRRFDFYRQAHRTGFTFFILLMMVVLFTVGILFLFDCNDLTIRSFIYTELALTYLLLLVRRTQILSLSCKPLTTFLYLCALELLPAATLVVPAAVL